MKKIRIILIVFGTLIIGFIIFRLFFMRHYYDFLEYWILRDKIAWSPQEKLTWQYFENNEGEGLYAKVGLSSRYNVNDPILFRSKTVFIPKESYVSDTTDYINLRVAQAKFDLLEVYRQKMEREVDSLRKVKNHGKTPSDFQEMNEFYYDLFDLEWDEFKSAKNQMEALKKLETRIQEALD